MSKLPTNLIPTLHLLLTLKGTVKAPLLVAPLLRILISGPIVFSTVSLSNQMEPLASSVRFSEGIIALVTLSGPSWDVGSANLACSDPSPKCCAQSWGPCLLQDPERGLGEGTGWWGKPAFHKEPQSSSPRSSPEARIPMQALHLGGDPRKECGVRDPGKDDITEQVTAVGTCSPALLGPGRWETVGLTPELCPIPPPGAGSLKNSYSNSHPVEWPSTSWESVLRASSPSTISGHRVADRCPWPHRALEVRDLEGRGPRWGDPAEAPAASATRGRVLGTDTVKPEEETEKCDQRQEIQTRVFLAKHHELDKSLDFSRHPFLHL